MVVQKWRRPPVLAIIVPECSNYHQVFDQANLPKMLNCLFRGKHNRNQFLFKRLDDRIEGIAVFENTMNDTY